MARFVFIIVLDTRAVATATEQYKCTSKFILCVFPRSLSCDTQRLQEEEQGDPYRDGAMRRKLLPVTGGPWLAWRVFVSPSAGFKPSPISKERGKGVCGSEHAEVTEVPEAPQAATS